MKTPLFILLTLSISGCSLIYSYSDNLSQRVDMWVTEKKYNVALKTISYIKPNHKDYRLLQRQKEIIKQKMISYENAAIEKSTQLSSQGEWIKALKLIDDVSNNVIDTHKLQKHRETLLIKRSEVITSYENEILYSQANNLASKMELYEKINKTVLATERNQLDISEFNDARHETTLRLAHRAEQQYKQLLFDDALTTIEFALKLKPNKEILSRLNTIKTHIKKDSKLIKETYVNNAKILLGKLSQGYSQLILIETKDTIIWLSKNDKNTHSELIKKLQAHLTKGVNQRFEAARNLYSKGKTQEALSIWLELKEIEPENTKLQSHIERAEKILIKLKKLTNKPKAIKK